MSFVFEIFSCKKDSSHPETKSKLKNHDSFPWKSVCVCCDFYEYAAEKVKEEELGELSQKPDIKQSSVFAHSESVAPEWVLKWQGHPALDDVIG